MQNWLCCYPLVRPFDGKGALVFGYLLDLLKIVLSLQGCSSPLVVKMADTQKEKEQKKMQQMTSNLWMQFSGLGALGPQYLAVSWLWMKKDPSNRIKTYSSVGRFISLK